jgi:hypothetical protein
VTVGLSLGHGLCSVPMIFGSDGRLRHVASDGHQYPSCGRRRHGGARIRGECDVKDANDKLGYV